MEAAHVSALVCRFENCTVPDSKCGGPIAWRSVYNTGWNKWQTNRFTPLHHQTVQRPPTDDNANMFNCLVFYCGNPYNSPWRADLSEPAQTAQLLRQTTHRSKINGIPHDVSIEIHLLNNCSNYFLCYASLLGLLWFSRQIRGFYAKSLDLNEICRKKGTLHFQPIPNVNGEFAFFDCSSFFMTIFLTTLGKVRPVQNSA